MALAAQAVDAQHHRCNPPHAQCIVPCRLSTNNSTCSLVASRVIRLRPTCSQALRALEPAIASTVRASADVMSSRHDLYLAASALKQTMAPRQSDSAKISESNRTMHPHASTRVQKGHYAAWRDLQDWQGIFRGGSAMHILTARTWI